MTFGKSRVQFNDFYWSFYRYDKFDTYFNQNGEELADYVADYVRNDIGRIENFFDYNFDKRIIFIVYNKLSDFRQSNIGLVSGKEEYNIGGVTQINKNKVFLFYEGDHQKFEQQISYALAQIFVQEIMFGGDLRENVTTNTLIDLPDWYVKGLVSYLSKDWSIELENRVKDGIKYGRYKKINQLQDEDAIYAGHSFWRYIELTYGEGVISNILYLTRVNKNVKLAFYSVLGLGLKELAAEWKAYYEYYFYANIVEDQFPSEPSVFKRPKKKYRYMEAKLSPNGKVLAYVTNQEGQYKIWLYNFEKRKKQRILKKEHQLEQIVDYSYPILAWHPSGRILSFIAEEEGGLTLYFYTLYNKELTGRNLLYYDKVLDFSYSDDGSKLVFSAVKNGKTDIFVFTLSSSTSEQITDDLADDLSPRFINRSTQILFASNRAKDTSSSSKALLHKDLFIVDYGSSSPEFNRLEGVNYDNVYQPYEISHNNFIALNDNNGVVNRYLYEFDSTISYIDTSIHYRYYTIDKALSNYSANVLEQNYVKESHKVSEIIRHKGRDFMYAYELDENNTIPDIDIITTRYKDELRKKIKTQDSLNSIEKKIIPLQLIENNQIVLSDDDTIDLDRYAIDVNNYIFEQEKINYYNQKYKDRNIIITVDTVKETKPKIRIYQPSFYANQLVSQVDFSFINASYQTFTGSQFYFNPGFNALMKIGVQDLFEDYKITGGYRFSIDFTSNEYLLSVENLKKQWDKQYIYHRQSYKNLAPTDGIYAFNSITNEFISVMSYPFSQVNAIRFTGNLRHDKTVTFADANNPQTLNIPTKHKAWLGAKVEYIFDNTRSLGKNLYSGTRYRLFFEAFKQVNLKRDDLFVFGADFRHYQVIHRNIIFASRFAASGSFGSSRLIYYLGGVDNWTKFLGMPRDVPIFIPTSEIPIDDAENYAFQAVATNMRGFSQNIRNGNNFALINNELRVPVFRYFANHPISSAFINNFQAVGFFDVGSAWSGILPWNSNNAYDKKEYPFGSGTVIIETNRNPIVAGYGYGVRSQLFGYFIRLDWAWGIENNIILPRIFYLSLNLDF